MAARHAQQCRNDTWRQSLIDIQRVLPVIMMCYHQVSLAVVVVDDDGNDERKVVHLERCSTLRRRVDDTLGNQIQLQQLYAPPNDVSSIDNVLQLTWGFIGAPSSLDDQVSQNSNGAWRNQHILLDNTILPKHSTLAQLIHNSIVCYLQQIGQLRRSTSTIEKTATYIIAIHHTNNNNNNRQRALIHLLPRFRLYWQSILDNMIDDRRQEPSPPQQSSSSSSSSSSYESSQNSPIITTTTQYTTTSVSPTNTTTTTTTTSINSSNQQQQFSSTNKPWINPVLRRKNNNNNSISLDFARRQQQTSVHLTNDDLRSMIVIAQVARKFIIARLPTKRLLIAFDQVRIHAGVISL
jgi:hypothetical protein